MRRTKLRELFKDYSTLAEKEIYVCAWVKTNRAQSQFGFLTVSDGTEFNPLQIVYDQKLENFDAISKIRV